MKANPQPAFSCSMLTTDTLNKEWNMSKVNNKNIRKMPIASFWFLFQLWTFFTPCSSVSIVNFEHVIAGWFKAAWDNSLINKIKIYTKSEGLGVVSYIGLHDWTLALGGIQHGDKTGILSLTVVMHWDSEIYEWNILGRWVFTFWNALLKIWPTLRCSIGNDNF